jgi:hypothetical protein
LLEDDMLSKLRTGHAATTNSDDRKISLIAVAVAVGILVAACAILVSSAPEPYDFTRTSALP